MDEGHGTSTSKEGGKREEREDKKGRGCWEERSMGEGRKIQEKKTNSKQWREDRKGKEPDG